jgi:rRNA pseudouridine-1189 N-methylase Emg1 (Nep1/Mra1 family)
MISIQGTKPNAVLALAQYAYTRVEPLFAQAKAVEPSIQFDIDLVFADKDSVYNHESHLRVYSHWNRDGMFQHSGWIESMDDVDLFASKLADDVANLADEVAA